MFCTNCGNEVADNAVVCVKCGVPPRSSNKFCYNCGETIAENQVICVKCGVALGATQAHSAETQPGGLWMSITSMVTGIFAILVSLVLVSAEEWEVTDSDCIIWLLLTAPTLALGIISIVKKKQGRKMAIAGTIMGGLAFLLGLL